MTLRWIKYAGICLSIWTVQTIPAQSDVDQQPELVDRFYAGSASYDVTPEVGSYLAGYGPDRRSTGKYDRLWVKAVALHSANNVLVLLTLDSIGLTRPDILRVELGIRQAIPRANVVVSSTHTHAGPDVVGIWGPAMWRSGRDERYLDKLVGRMIEAGVQAYESRRPAVTKVASALVPFDWVTNRSEPDLLDSQMSVLQVLTQTGETIATLTNYACHPTILGPDNTKVSADYVHGFYAQMNRTLPGEHLFFQGAIGGWVQPIQGDQSHALAVRLGEELARQALQLLAQAQDNLHLPSETADYIEFASQEFDVPLENWGFRLLIWLGVIERELYAGAMRTSVAWFRIGRALFVTHPGETSPAYSLASRDLMDAEYTFVFGLTQDAMGYILKPEYFADDTNYPHGEYLTSVSVGEQAGPRLMQTLGKLIP